MDALGQVLSNPEIGDFEIKTLLNQSSGVVRREIEEFFAKRKRDDLLLLYFSGHGLKDDYGRLYFATAETMRSHLRSTALSANYVNESMRDSRSRQQVLLLDCCYSGAFAKGMMVKADTSVGTKEQFEGKGRVILTASDSLQYAFEGDNVEGDGVCSIFTQALVEGLYTGKADLDQDGQITLDEIYDYVHDQVTVDMPQQRPGKWAFDVQGDIVIAKNPNPVVNPVDLPIELQQSIIDPRTWVREGAARELGRLLKSHDLGLKQSAYSALEGMAEDDSLRVRDLISELLAKYPRVELSGDVEAETATQGVIIPRIPKETKVNIRSIKDYFLLIPIWAWIIAGMVFLFIMVFLFGSMYRNFGIAFRVTDTPTATFELVIAHSLTKESTLTKTLTPEPSPSRTPVPTDSTTTLPSPTPSPTNSQKTSPTLQPTLTTLALNIVDDFGVPMALVPAGSFLMGSNIHDVIAECRDITTDCWFKGEQPIHTVVLNDFYIDQYEVTNSLYADCVKDGACNPPNENSSSGRESYYGNDDFTDYPVVNITWYDAKSYCEWREARLPSEAEWEKAARGGLEGKHYPWGDSFDGTLLNYCDVNCTGEHKEDFSNDGYPNLAQVGSYPPNDYGLYDMAGNVYEWCEDWYEAYPGGDPNANINYGKKYRIIRGGDWDSTRLMVRVANRVAYSPDLTSGGVGIRCVRSP